MATNRRSFIKGGVMAAGAIAAPSIVRAGADQKIRMGFIGIGNRGTEVMRQFMNQPDVEVAALCDCYKPYLDRDASAVDPKFFEYGIGGAVPKFDKRDQFGPNVKRYSDYRRLLEDKNVDAVMIATPDHQHAIMTIDAIKAGKDVYCEKPLSATIVEGRAMVNAQKASKQVVAVGLNRRGSDAFRKLVAEVRTGKYGTFLSGRGARLSNLAPYGIGKCPDCEPPKGFDWDAWLGPRAYRPYKYTTAPYFFRWHTDFSSQVGNWGVHYLDAMRWMMDEVAPCAVTAIGGKYYTPESDAEIPDTMFCIYEFADGKVMEFNVFEGGRSYPLRRGEIELASGDATVFSDQKGWQIEPSKGKEFKNPVKKFEPRNYVFQEALLDDGSAESATKNVINDFVARCFDRGTPLCPLEEGHRSTSFAHLANISLKMGQRLEWDAVNERFTNCEKANEFLHYDYRDGYKLG